MLLVSFSFPRLELNTVRENQSDSFQDKSLTVKFPLDIVTHRLYLLDNLRVLRIID
jgi:hypothetical protein